MSDDKLMDDLRELTDGLAAPAAVDEAQDSDEDKSAPVYSDAGNIRNLSKMGVPKFEDLRDEMEAYKNRSPKGYAAVKAEHERRRNL